ncbi:hypothetical protein L484_020297 [Morus notabilis]|uniref:Uncharacterized protein n=1 Tax=Morus notabilis TaxID=981085 RepID=W9R2Z9_9ROSA|nr:hypothetical protein L484_020297 [Morus notabilis]
MAFVISEAQQSFSHSEAEKVTQQDDRPSPITSQLYLKSSSSSSSSSKANLNKDVVLRRIRHHKCLNKVRSAFQGLLVSSDSEEAQQKWLDQNDSFSSP